METKQNELHNVHSTVDNRGIPCTLGIFKVMRAMEQVPSGAILAVLSTDRSSKNDLGKWASRMGHQILACEEIGGPLRSVFRFIIRKCA